MAEKRKKDHISLVVPAYNEADGIDSFYQSLTKVLRKHKDITYELIFINDGSSDTTESKLHALAAGDRNVVVLSLSRNFGKEVATTAGINNARGDAIVILDADGQHPVELIPTFLSKWRDGNKVVIGIRTQNQKEGFVKRYGSKLFYKLINKVAGVSLIPGSTDFRLIDRSVQQDFMLMTERNRITRGLIDWLGYEREYVAFIANPRVHGEASYSTRKLVALAVNSFVSLSHSPLYFATYTGLVIIPLSILLACLMALEQLLGDPLSLNITGSAYLVLATLLLVGIVLFSQGILGLYLSHIHAETQNRPLYVINHAKSVRSKGDEEHTIQSA